MNFTCPGEDLFTGIISQFNIYFSKTNLQELTLSSNVSTVTQEMINMGDLHPQQPHDVVHLRLSSSFFEAGTSYSFRVMAIDEGEKFSVSNIVSVIPEYVEDVEVGQIRNYNSRNHAFFFLGKLSIFFQWTILCNYGLNCCIIYAVM